MISTRHALAALLLVAALPGCGLYFGHEHGDDIVGDPFYPDAGPNPGHPYPDAPDPPGGGGGGTFARCEDGVVRSIGLASLPAGDMPGHGAGTLIGHCATSSCQSAIAECTGNNCQAAMNYVCTAPATLGAPTTLQGSACSTPNDTVSYGETTTCGQAVGGGTCTCDGSSFDCTPSSPTAQVHAQLVGKWSGMVYPPSFAQPYPVSLWIYPDGTYWADAPSGPTYTNAFYYGGDGPHPWRRIDVLATSDTLGAYANIGIFTDFNVGALSSLFVSSTTLTFTYNASWQSCGQPFTFQLTRQ